MKPSKTTVTFLALGTAFAAWAFCTGSSGRCGLLSTALAQGPQLTRVSNGTGGEPAAPDWRLAGVDGKTVQLSDFKGKVVVLNFWATWCPPCRKEIPDLIALQKKYGNDLVVVGVSLDENGPAAVKSFVAKSGINYPVVMGDQGTASAYGGIKAIPTTFVIDRAGKIVGQIEGGADLAGFESAIKATLSSPSKS